MGFSVVGLLIAVAILLPNVLLIAFPPRGRPLPSVSAGLVFTILERAGQLGCLVALVLAGEAFDGRPVAFAIVISVFVAAYWGLWGRYLRTRRAGLLFSPWLRIPIPMAVFPVLAFATAALWSLSPWLGLAALVLAIGHLANSWAVWKVLRAGE